MAQLLFDRQAFVELGPCWTKLVILAELQICTRARRRACRWSRIRAPGSQNVSDSSGRAAPVGCRREWRRACRQGILGGTSRRVEHDVRYAPYGGLSLTPLDKQDLVNTFELTRAPIRASWTAAARAMRKPSGSAIPHARSRPSCRSTTTVYRAIRNGSTRRSQCASKATSIRCATNSILNCR